MIQHISINPHQIQGFTQFNINFSDQFSGFPLLLIDTDSYIVGADIQSAINSDIAAGRHHLAIGKGCSLAESITFMIDLNHDYGSIVQGDLSFLQETTHTQKISRKASIILQNDVWVGHGATIMAGVTLHNGCVVAANSVVTKDVPPYAIVGGNPAKILRYRFNRPTIQALQKIAWWDWPKELHWHEKKTLICLSTLSWKNIMMRTPDHRPTSPSLQQSTSTLSFFLYQTLTIHFLFIPKY